MTNLYLAIDGLSVIALLVLAILALSQGGYRRTNNKLFAAFSLLVAVWIPANHLGNNASIDPSLVLIANYLVFVCSFGALFLLMCFVTQLVSDEHIRRVARVSSLPLVGVGLLSATPLLVKSVQLQGSVYAISFGPFVWLYAAGLFSMIGMVMWAVVKGLREVDSVSRQQLAIVSFGLAVSLPLVLLLSFVLPLLTHDFSYTEYGITPIIILVFALYYGVVRYKLFDIRFAAIRGLAYILSLVTLATVYYGLVYAASLAFFGEKIDTTKGIGVLNLLLVLVLVFIFQPIRQFFDRVTGSIFFRDSYDSEVFFAKVNRTLTSTTDLRTLLERVSLEVASTLKSEQVFLYAYHTENRHVSAGTSGHETLTIREARLVDELAAQQHHRMIVVQELIDDTEVRNTLRDRRISVLLPLNRDGYIIGYLVLGERRSGRYTPQDIRALDAISDSLVIAIQNALSVQEVKDLNATLQQRIDEATKELRASNEKLRHLDATKDEFVSMASHQLRTPLTSVKGYISMVLDGDAGKITDMQRQLLGEAFTSSERMVHLINDFLNVSRLQTGKFMIDRQAVDFAKVVEQEVQSLQSTAHARNLTLQYRKPSKFPILYLDEGKLRQVVMNFIDNAFYYSREHSTVTVVLEAVAGEVILRVKDAGMGVPEAEQKRLFTKFFRATNARKQRPDGTGVGLFLAKKVVTAHGGSVIFESVEGKGSTFGFRLPVKKLSLAPAEGAN